MINVLQKISLGVVKHSGLKNVLTMNHKSKKQLDCLLSYFLHQSLTCELGKMLFCHTKYHFKKALRKLVLSHVPTAFRHTSQRS